MGTSYRLSLLNPNKKSLVLGLLFAVLCSGAVIADDGGMRDLSGGTVEPLVEHPTIRMVSETVDMKLGAKVGNDWRAFTRCLFVLKNDGPATDVTIGFPESAWSGGEGSPSGRLTGFKSWVDDEPVSVKYVPSSKNKKRTDSNSREEYNAWYVKKVNFKAGQTRTIIDVYAVRLGESYSIGSTSTYMLNYILRSGSTWHGSIGQGVINADLSEIRGIYDIKATPKGFVRTGDKLRWTFKDLNPNEDIHIDLSPSAPIIVGDNYYLASMWDPFFLKNGVLMVSPIPFGGESGSVEQGNKRLVIKGRGHVLVMTANSRTAVLDGRKIKLKTAPYYHDGFAVPLNETVKLLGGSAKYDKDHRPNIYFHPVSHQKKNKR